MRTSTVIFIALCVAVVWSQSQKILRSRQLGFEGQILARILSEYDDRTRPPVRDAAEHSSIVVIVSLYINRIVWHDHDADVDLYLRQQWEDQRLVYEVDTREGIEEVVVPQHKRIWMPDTYFTSGEDIIVHNRRRIVIEPSGFIRSSEMRSIKVGISYGSKFPFVNSRSFKLRISSYNYPIEDIVYLWANSPPTIVPVEVAPELLSGRFEFSEAIAEDCVGNYTVGVYSCIEVEVTFAGSATEALFRVFIPSIFLIFASWLHFWVHGSWSVPRTISAAVPFFLFASLLVFYPQPYLSYEGVGGIQIWFLFCLLITFASLLEYFVVICCGIRRTVRYTNGQVHETETLPVQREIAEVQYDAKCAKFKENNGIDIIARLLFPTIFIFFSITFLIAYLL